MSAQLIGFIGTSSVTDFSFAPYHIGYIDIVDTSRSWMALPRGSCALYAIEVIFHCCHSQLWGREETRCNGDVQRP